MRSIIITLLTILVTFPNTTFSQDFDYEVSKPYKVIDAVHKQYLYKDGEVMAVKAHGKEFVIIQKWESSSMNEISRKNYEDLPGGFTLEGFESFNDNYYMFYSVWDKTNKYEQLFAREIDFASGKFIDNGKLLLRIEGKITSPFGASMFGGLTLSIGTGASKFNIQKSYNEERVLIQYRKKPTTRNDDLSYDIIGLGIFDEFLTKISIEEVKMPYTESKMNNLDYSIDSRGFMYILSMVYKDDTQKLTDKEGNVNYNVELLRIDEGSTEITHTPIKLEDDLYLNEIILFNQKDDGMICAGFYTNNKKTLNNANGVVMFKLDEYGELSDMVKYEIPTVVLNMYRSEKSQKKTKKKEEKGQDAEFSNLEMRELIVYEDGSSLLIGEQHYIVQHTYTTSNGSTRTYYTYHYNDILVVKMDASGELEWMKKLGKRQTGRKGQGGMSYKHMQSKDAHYFLFLDNVKNLDLEKDKWPAVHSDGAGGFLTAYKIDDSSGEVSKVSLFDMRDVHGIDVFQFAISRIVQTGPEEIMVEVYKKKKEDILIKVKIKI